MQPQDVFSKEKRSEVMARIGGKNTRPEMVVRSLLHRLGYRFRLHSTSLPGKPDIVLKKHSTVVFVNGCFWHQHQGCSAGRLPKSRVEFWKTKLERNVERDREKHEKLLDLGWKVVVIWECEIKRKNIENLKAKLEALIN